MAEQRANNIGGATGHGWKPGQSGNPAGRPKSRPIAAALKELCDKNDGEALRALAAVCLKKALHGDYRFARELMDRIDGKVADALDITGALDTGRSLTDDEAAAVANIRALRAAEAMGD